MCAWRLERLAGRERTRRWTPRTLDMDLLMLGEHTHHTSQLQLPHPRLAERRFVLQPWADLSPDCYIENPFLSTVEQLLHVCPDRAAIRKTSLRWD